MHGSVIDRLGWLAVAAAGADDRHAVAVFTDFARLVERDPQRTTVCTVRRHKRHHLQNVHDDVLRSEGCPKAASDRGAPPVPLPAPKMLPQKRIATRNTFLR